MKALLKSPLFWAVVVGVVVFYAVRSVINKAKAGAGAAADAVKKAAKAAIVEPVEAVTEKAAEALGYTEAEGYATSEGQTDKRLKYNQARVAFSKAQGYKPGTEEWRNPPGWPSYEEWLDNQSAVTN